MLVRQGDLEKSIMEASTDKCSMVNLMPILTR